MSFFYDLNKKLDSIRATPEVTHQQLNERDMKKTGKLEEEGFPAYAKGIMKYGKDGMDALRDAEAEGEALGPVRKKHNKYDNEKVSEESNSEEYSSPPEYKGGKYLPPVVDRSRPADKPNVEKRPQSGKDSSPPEWKGKYLPPVDDRSRPAKEVDESDFGPGRAGPNKNLPGPEYSFSPDTKNYKTPHSDACVAASQNIDKTMGQGYSAKNYPTADVGAAAMDARGQTKYINRTAPGVINKIKDKLGYDMPDPAYGPRPDERERLIKRYPAPAKSVDEGGEVINGVYKLAIEPKRPEEEENKMTRGTRPKSNKSNQLFPPMRLPSDEKFPPMRLPKGDERVFPPMRLPTDENLIPVPAKPKSTVDKQIDKAKTPPPTRPTRPNPAPKGEFMGTIKGGVWTADPPKPGEKGVPVPKNHERVPEAGAPMTAKRKFTFADKIANAKKEVDEMLGDVAAEAMRTALSPKQKKIDMNKNGKLDANDFAMLRQGRKPEMDEERSKGTAFDLSTPRATKPKVGSIERGHKHDIKHTATGRMVTRRTDDQGISVGADDDDADTQAGPRGRGRPKGTKQSIGAKGPSGKSKLMTREGEVDIRDQGEYDQEGDMAKDDIKTIVRHAQALSKVLGDNDNLPEWVQSKLSKIEGMMISIDEYMQNQESDEEEPIAEKAVSKKQQRFMGMVHSAQKGEKPASRAVGKVANTMKPKDTADFAKTKHKGLPEKKKKEVDENSEDGRLTVKQTGPGQTSTSSSTGRISATVDKGTVSVKPAKSGGMSYGKGIYDSINLELENMIAESMSINMSDSTEGNKSLTVTATDDDAMKLAMILKSAGLGGGDMHGGDMHGHMVDENAPDYPTNTQTSNDALQYAGGLNKPKADIAGNGQSTVPVVATRPQNEEDALRRMMEMAGLTEGNMPMVKKDGKMVPAFAADGKGENDLETKDKEEDTVEESIQRMREMAGIREAKKAVDEEKTEEGNLFTAGLEDDDVKIGDKIPGTNAIKKKDIDESIFALTNQWQAYKG